MVSVGLLQVASPVTESIGPRRERVRRLIDSLTDVDLIVLPELWPAGYFHFDTYAGRSENVDGPSVALARDVARSRSCFVHAGSIIEAGAGGRLHNTSVLVDPGGQVVLVYRKVHVFGYQSREAELITPGDSPSVHCSDQLGGIGAVTCYDLRFPQLWSDMVDLGAEIVIVPAAWPAARLEHWRLFTTARAVENQVVVIGCNTVGEQAGVALAGHSRVVDPWGSVLYEAGGDAEEATVVRVDLAVVSSARREFPVLQDRRRVRAGQVGDYLPAPSRPSRAGEESDADAVV